jgi:serine/threonine-protein kinase RsbW
MQERSWTYPAEPASVPAARRRVAVYAGEHGVPEPPLENLKLAVTEAMTNCVVHAFRDGGDAGTFTVEVDLEPGRNVTVRVTDDGEGMGPRVDSPGLGLGLGIISALATATELRTPDTGRGTEVCMCFSLTS